jgi:hypothetical protein
MDESELNDDLKAFANQPNPDLPSDLTESVFARIRLVKTAAAGEHWLDALVTTLLRPEWAVGVLVITIMIGGNLGRILVSSESGATRAPLGLDVFMADSPTLPSTVLSKSR